MKLKFHKLQIMSKKRERPPSSSPPPMSMPWMKVGSTSMMPKFAANPIRSPLLKNSSRSSNSSELLTHGQISRLQIADTVRFVINRGLGYGDGGLIHMVWFVNMLSRHSRIYLHAPFILQKSRHFY